MTVFERTVWSRSRGGRSVLLLSIALACPVFEDSHRNHLLLLCGSCHAHQKFVILGTPPEGPCSFRIRSQKRACGGAGKGCSVQHFTVSFVPFCVFQVYVSYDYGKSFNKISEKLNFGVGNSSEAVISQFYHSPADNKRVRRLWLWSVAFWEDGCTEGDWAIEPFAVFAAHTGHRLLFSV